ncbi:MAG: glycosyltransferase family 61 protein [Akkermansiaceae bacterium]|nr:glycosyltransferase family 61 protein [Akkermansiaceae bacterium]
MPPSSPHADRSSWNFPVPETIAQSTAPPGSPLSFAEARIFSHNGVVIDAENRLRAGLSPDFRPPPSGHRVLDYSGLPEPKPVDAHVLALATPACWKNYFHWIIDALPRLRSLDLRDFDLVCTPLGQPFHAEALEALDIPADRWLEATVDSHFLCRRVTGVSPLPIGAIDRDGISFLRDTFRIQPQAPSRRIYVSRSDAWRRRLLNEDDFQPFLRRLGFETVTITGLTIREQADLFSSAQAVIAPHGAALANLVFAPPACRVLELFPDNLHSPHFENLAAICGIRHIAHPSPAANIDGDFHLQLDLVPAVLERFLR